VQRTDVEPFDLVGVAEGALEMSAGVVHLFSPAPLSDLASCLMPSRIARFDAATIANVSPPSRNARHATWRD
jgi:hypothetical protein